ncbi:hypothetical protein DRO42_00440 [Candidatus Bathyarchaeota archaeon]|nr:MAG: hypothetical protein DRO42_00440 [Candidatus Bathyarchaeota archaeon]
MASPYHYIRYIWWGSVDMEKVAEELGAAFSIEAITLPRDDRELSLFKDERDALRARADTLAVILSPVRAILYQREPMPFTARDLELRSRILELYPRDRPTPFPWSFSFEPKFEVAEEGPGRL